MKKFVCVLVAMMTMLPSFAQSSVSTRRSKIVTSKVASSRSSDAETQRLIRKLWKGIPDHGMTDFSRSSLSEEFYRLCEEGFDMPPTEPFGIGEEELMYYWYTAQDEDRTDGIVSIKIISKSDDKIEARVKYRNLGTVKPHDIVLIKERGEWRIDDFDGMKGVIKDFVTRWRSNYSSGRYLQDLDSFELSPDEKREYIKSVDEYLMKYRAK